VSKGIRMTVKGRQLVISIPFRLRAQAEPAGDKPGALADPFLTPRHRQILDGILAGSQNKEIAAKMGISVRTVKVHVTAVLKLFGVHSRYEIQKAFWQRK
jgi:DNA-binding NarL/FixJ family response regulator